VAIPDIRGSVPVTVHPPAFPYLPIRSLLMQTDLLSPVYLTIINTELEATITYIRRDQGSSLTVVIKRHYLFDNTGHL